MAAHAAVGPNIVSAIVWEWQRDDGGFSPYPPEVGVQIEGAKALGSAVVPLGKWSVDLSKMVQIRLSSGNQRTVRRSPCRLPSSPDLLGYWEWEVSRRRFVPYGIQASVDIELASLIGCGSVDLSTSPSCVPYTVDFVKQTQTRHGYGTERRVRRVTLHKPLQKLLCVSSKLTGIVSGPAHHPPSTGMHSHGYSTYGSSFGLATPASTLLSTGGPTAAYPLPAPRPLAIGTGTSKSSISGRRVKKVVKSSEDTGSSGTMPMAPPTGKGKTVKGSVVKKGKKPRSKTSADIANADDDSSFLGLATGFVKRIRTLNFGEDGPCPICMNQLSESSGFEEDAELISPAPSTSQSSSLSPPSPDLYKLRRCGHLLHRPCLLMLVRNSSDKNGLSCPTCKKIHGVRTGDMPNGRMSVAFSSYSLPSHEGNGTIEITYSFTSGTHNGVHYRANGFPRTCFLPDSPKGRKVLSLLQIAWDRRLTFTIGTSVTTGATNTIVWNEIHHKTEATSNHSGHGYPDPNYLDNVLAELAAQGVEEKDDSEEDASSDSSL